MSIVTPMPVNRIHKVVAKFESTTTEMTITPTKPSALSLVFYFDGNSFIFVSVFPVYYFARLYTNLLDHKTKFAKPYTRNYILVI